MKSVGQVLVGAALAVGVVAAGSATATAAPVGGGSGGVVTPSDIAAAAPVDQAGDVQAAIGNAATTLGLATAVGGMAGGIAGAAIGCPLGALTGGTLMVPTVVGTPLGLVGGCLIGASVVGSTGAILGGAVLGVPAVIAGAGQVLGALQEPLGADTGVPATIDAAQ